MAKVREVTGGALRYLQTDWNKPAQGVTALAGSIFGYFGPPPDSVALGGMGVLAVLGRTFIIPVVWLLMSVPARSRQSRVDRYLWFWVAAGMLIVSLGVWIGNAWLVGRWTFTYTGRNNPAVVIKGSRLNPELAQARRYSAKNFEDPPRDITLEVAGR